MGKRKDVSQDQILDYLLSPSKASSSEFDYFDEDAEVIDVDNFLPPVQSPEFTPEATPQQELPGELRPKEEHSSNETIQEPIVNMPQMEAECSFPETGLRAREVLQ